MYFSDRITLQAVSITFDDIGNQIEALTDRLIFANPMYVSSREFYNAATAGLKPEKMFEIYTEEYGGEDRLTHDGIAYRIIRTETRGEKTRIICERVSADG
jgi:head-tail adaptor